MPLPCLPHPLSMGVPTGHHVLTFFPTFFSSLSVSGQEASFLRMATAYNVVAALGAGRKQRLACHCRICGCCPMSSRSVGTLGLWPISGIESSQPAAVAGCDMRLPKAPTSKRSVLHFIPLSCSVHLSPRQATPGQDPLVYAVVLVWEESECRDNRTSTYCQLFQRACLLFYLVLNFTPQQNPAIEHIEHC